MSQKIYNLAIIGGGPSGLSAAISAGSEMSDVILFDSGKKLAPNQYEGIIGGQIRETARIENHPGVISASGRELIDTFVTQAKGMGVDIHCPTHVQGIEMLEGDIKRVTTREGEAILARAVLLANGLSYNRLPEATGADALLGSGVKYGAMDIDPKSLGTCRIGIIGAANSAGQAVLKLAENTDASITIYVRGLKSIEDQMSQYLVNRIRATPSIFVQQNVEVAKVVGSKKLERVILRDGSGEMCEQECDHLFVFIGAVPKVQWLQNAVAMNPRGFILTGSQLGQTTHFQPLPYETSMSGVFAAGDILLDPTKRVTTAAGHGSSAVAAVHRYFAMLASGERQPAQLQAAE